jgi:hypothetical protein
MSALDYKQKRINRTGRKAKSSQAGYHSYLLASELIPRFDDLFPIFLEVQLDGDFIYNTARCGDFRDDSNCIWVGV